MSRGVSVNFGSRISEQRTAAGLSQTKAAELCGVSREMWGKYERGLASPGAEVLARAALAGLDVMYILTGSTGSPNPSTSTDFPKEQPVQITDEHRLRLAAEGVFEGLAEIKRKLPPAKLAELIVVAYQLTAGPEQQAKSNVLRLVRAAA